MSYDLHMRPKGIQSIHKVIQKVLTGKQLKSEYKTEQSLCR